MGTKNQGQGHETMFKQILNERLGIDPNDVQYIDGDTDRVAFGMGTNGSRSTVLGGSALFVAADKVIEKGKMLAGHLLEAGEQDIEFADGNFTVKGTDKSVPSRRSRRRRSIRPSGRRASRAGCTRTRPSTARRTPIPTAATSARSRSIRRRATSRSTATSWSTMSAR